MKQTKRAARYGLKINFALIVALACLLGQVLTQAGATPFSRIVVFGDSLSDTGNFYHRTGNSLPPAPYAGGRFSNGPLWIEYLAEDLGMELVPGDNYAVGGATTGHDNTNDGVLGLTYPGLQDEIGSFLETLGPGGADPEALYVVWAGANDFFVVLASGGDPAVLIRNGVSNTLHAIQSLWAAGARHILVLNVPDLGITPYGRGSGFGASITYLSASYNHFLGTGLQALAQAGIPTIQVDAFSTLQLMVNSPEQFGFTNVTVPLLPVLLGGGNPDSAEFVFWDAVHPTTRAHEVLEGEVVNRLVDYFSPTQGTGSPDARLNALNGLLEKAANAP